MPTAPQTPTHDIRSLIETDKFKSSVAAILPSHLTPTRFLRILASATTRTPKLLDCDPQSFLQCCMQLSQFGLEPDGRHAHLIPFWNSKRNCFECTLIIDFKGLANLALRSGQISYVHADKVCDNDDFQYDKGIVTKHVINFHEDRGKPYAYYAMVKFKDGTEKADAMTMAEVKAIKQRSRAKDSGPWVTDFDEMGKKTVFRRLSKWLPLSAEYRDAVDLDTDALEELRFDNAKPLITRPKVPRILDSEKEILGGGVPKADAEKHEETPTSAPPSKTTLPQQPLADRNEEGQKSAAPSEKKTEKLGRKKKAHSTESQLEQADIKQVFTPYGEKQAEMEKRLKIGGFTTDDLMTVAHDNGWAEGKWPVLEETLDRFLTADNWQVITEELEALKK